jgi:acyl-CoA thioesterase I
MGAVCRLVTFAILGSFFLVMSSALYSCQAQTPPARLKIVAFGDSLTAGYQLPPDKSFPVQLQAALKARGRDVEIINAGVSGDTTSGGLARIDWAVPPDASGVILELGANDALRGVDPAQTARALDEIVVRLKARGLAVLLAGMQAPRNLGEDYRTRFDAIFPDLAKTHGLPLRPFFLDGVALDPKLTLDDRMHPTANGVAVMVEGILPDVLRLLDQIEANMKKG